MAQTLGGMSAQLRKLAADIPLRANSLKQDVAKTVNFNLLQSTPVDTAAAMSNWIVNLDDASDEQRDPFVAGKAASNGKRYTDPETLRQANVGPATDEANIAIDAVLPGQSIHITNNLEYIQALEDGHSEQAQNFVAKSIILAESLLSRARLTD